MPYPDAEASFKHANRAELEETRGWLFKHFNVRVTSVGSCLPAGDPACFTSWNRGMAWALMSAA